MRALRSPAARAVATVLARAREKRGLTQRELAARLKRRQSVIAMIETNQRQVNVPEFLILAKTLEIDPIELLKQVLREAGG